MLTSKSPRKASFHGLTDGLSQMIGGKSKRPCSRSQRIFFCVTFLLAILLPAARAFAQTEEIGDGDVDPIKLFERGQNAHARGNLAVAIAFYEQAIKLRPEFPEAEFQRGSALVGLGRSADAEPA